MKKGLYYACVLAAYCLVSAAALAWVFNLTLSPIAQREKKAVQESLALVLPQADEFKPQVLNAEQQKKYQFLYNALIAGQDPLCYQGLKKGRPAGFVYSVFPKGYSGPIKMKVGIDPGGRVVGVKIVDQNETPGLGSQITTDDFQGSGRPFTAQFSGKTDRDQLAVKKDIQAITGATISSRGVIQGVKDTLELFNLGQNTSKQP